jgi:hypothetical protein
MDRYRGYAWHSIREDRSYGTKSNPKVWVMREFSNSADNNLGMPLPRGRMRFYRRDGQQLEFIGENTIDHTPQDELVRVYTGNAFDLVGERRQTDFSVNHSAHELEESFEIKLRNRKKEAVEVRVVERLYRWFNWSLLSQSDPYEKVDAQTIEFRVMLEPDQEKVVTYRVKYTW